MAIPLPFPDTRAINQSVEGSPMKKVLLFIVLVSGIAVAASTGYHKTNEIKIGGAGQWDERVRTDHAGQSSGLVRKECLEAVRQWPGCETVGGIQIIRSNKPGDFSVRVTLYGKADKKIADRAIIYIQREKRRHFHLTE
jgi:hypothetical protein